MTSTRQLQPVAAPTIHIVRNSGAKADVTISSTAIKLNQIKQTRTVTNDGADYWINTPPPAHFSVVNHFSRMTREARTEFFSGKTFEIFIDTQTLVDPTSATVLDQIRSFRPFFEQIQKLRVVLFLPYKSLTKLPQESIEHQFITNLVASVQALESLTNVDIVLDLPAAHCRWSYDWILPFYDLHFSDWKLLCEVKDQQQAIGDDHLTRMDTRRDRIVRSRRAEEDKVRRQREEEDRQFHKKSEPRYYKVC